jgi:hypothetical protein
MLEILMIKITKFMEVLNGFLEEKIAEGITYLEDIFGDGKTNKDNGKALDNSGSDNNDPENSGPDNNDPENSGPNNNDPENSGPNNNDPENSGPDNNDSDKDSSEGDDKPQKLDKGKGKAMETNPDDLPKEGLSKKYPLTEAEIKKAEEEHNYQVTRLLKIKGELEGKAGESSKGELVDELLEKYGQNVQPSEEGVQQPDPLVSEYYKTLEYYQNAVRKYNDANQQLMESTNLDETQRAQLIAESQHLRAVAESAGNHAKVLRSLVDIPSDPERCDSEEEYSGEEYSGEDYGSEENNGKESSDEKSRPSKRPESSDEESRPSKHPESSDEDSRPSKRPRN